MTNESKKNGILKLIHCAEREKNEVALLEIIGFAV